MTQAFITVKDKIEQLKNLEIPDSPKFNAFDLSPIQDTFKNLQVTLKPSLQSFNLSRTENILELSNTFSTTVESFFNDLQNHHS